ncbi:MAG: LysR family transcriptional regulator [Hyphomicrobiaceae bacterium]
MDIQDLRIFARVARVQNLSAVGAEFDLSAGTISKRLQGLEAELQVRLFDRTTRSIHMTEEGQTLLADMERILGELDQALDTLSASVEGPRGRLRVSAPTSLGRGMIAPAICAFMSHFPEIDIHLDLTDRIVTFPDSGYDVAIRTGQLADSSLIAKRLAPDPQVVVASPEYIAAKGEPASPEEVGRHACLMLGDEQQWTFRQGEKVYDVRVAGRLRSDNGEVLRHAAIEGLGLLKLGHNRVADAIRAGSLRIVLDGYDAGSDSAIWAVYPSNRHILPKLRVFLEFLSDWYKDCRKSGTGLDGQAVVSTGDRAALRA